MALSNFFEMCPLPISDLREPSSLNDFLVFWYSMGCYEFATKNDCPALITFMFEKPYERAPGESWDSFLGRNGLYQREPDKILFKHLIATSDPSNAFNLMSLSAGADEIRPKDLIHIPNRADNWAEKISRYFGVSTSLPLPEMIRSINTKVIERLKVRNAAKTPIVKKPEPGKPTGVNQRLKVVSGKEAPKAATTSPKKGSSSSPIHPAKATSSLRVQAPPQRKEMTPEEMAKISAEIEEIERAKDELKAELEASPGSKIPTWGEDSQSAEEEEPVEEDFMAEIDRFCGTVATHRPITGEPYQMPPNYVEGCVDLATEQNRPRVEINIVSALAKLASSPGSPVYTMDAFNMLEWVKEEEPNWSQWKDDDLGIEDEAVRAFFTRLLARIHSASSVRLTDLYLPMRPKDVVEEVKKIVERDYSSNQAILATLSNLEKEITFIKNSIRGIGLGPSTPMREGMTGADGPVPPPSVSVPLGTRTVASSTTPSATEEAITRIKKQAEEREAAKKALQEALASQNQS